MTEPEAHDQRERRPDEGYEAPTIEVLGTVAELTQTIQGSLDV